MSELNVPQWLAGYEVSWSSVLWGSALFALLFTLSIALVVIVFVRIPADYFRESATRSTPNRHPVIHKALGILKNIVGIILMVVGIIMFVTPGQGMLTLLVGILLTDIPGKRRLEAKIIRRPAVLEAVNRLRARYGRPPLVFDDDQCNGPAGPTGQTPRTPTALDPENDHVFPRAGNHM